VAVRLGSFWGDYGALRSWGNTAALRKATRNRRPDEYSITGHSQREHTYRDVTVNKMKLTEGYIFGKVAHVLSQVIHHPRLREPSTGTWTLSPSSSLVLQDGSRFSATMPSSEAVPSQSRHGTRRSCLP
jgi:hypothetical protein